MTTKPARIGPPRPKAPIGRLATLKSPATSINRPQSIGRTHPPRPKTHPKTTNCPNPGCPAPHIVEEDGQKLCTGCGTVIAETNIVSEVTFGESSSGAAVVQGTFVGEGQSHTRSFGPGFQRGGGMESRELTEANGNTYIAQLARPLNIPESATKAAGQVFKLAVGLNFIQGRRTKTVAAVCLYIACRRTTGNTVMLIDFADILMVNVFKLGRTYKALIDELRLGGTTFLVNPIDPESLIYRFAKSMEFGPSSMRVAGEAVRIIQRMNRDWLSTGRRPAGTCAAALLLAARMNNFRRTARETVYIVKVTEITINQRLHEFSMTESGDLTVDQFRSVQLENSHDPPAFTRAREGHKSSRSTKKPAGAATENDDNLASAAGSVQPRRVDADGFAIPDLPIDPALTDSTSRRASYSKAAEEVLEEGKLEMAKSKGTDKSNDPRRPALLANPTPEELASEDALVDEIEKMMKKGSTMVESLPEPKKLVPDAVDIGDHEFDDDPEVANCLLTPAEIDLKEAIWVTENKDYLREQQEKMMKRAYAEATGGGTTRKPRKRRKTRMGDVTYLEGEDGERGSRASTPAEATRRMLEVRGYSKKINYSLLENLYSGEKEGDAAETKQETLSRSRSRSRSRSMSVVSRQSLPPAATPGRRRRKAATPAPVSPPSRPPVPAFKSTPVSAPMPVPVPAPKSAPTSALESALQPTPPPTAQEATQKDAGPEDELASDQKDPDDMEENDDDYYVDDHVDDAFAGNYGDDYYDVSDSD